MQIHGQTYLLDKVYRKAGHLPLEGQVELTYRCNLRCIHCYCKGSEPNAGVKRRELSTKAWKKIFDDLQNAGCFSLVLTGGEPLVRKDFLELYAHAKRGGFLITLFTNAYALNEKIVDFLAQSPPHSIEITLNGTSQKTYEAITCRRGAFKKVTDNIRRLAKKFPSLIIKANCLKENRHEIGSIKRWTEDLLGAPKNNLHHFRYDPMIYPRLDGDTSPCSHRLSPQELWKVRKQDGDIFDEYQEYLACEFPDLAREKDFLYSCNTWLSQFNIDPYGHLKFCPHTDKFSVDLKKTSFHDGFYNVFPQVTKEKFKTNSKCRVCRLRPICYFCPSRAYLETGDEEGPVPYYCQLAQATLEQDRALRRKN